MELQLGRLIASLAPSPQRCIAEVAGLLPILGSQAYNAFITKVGHALPVCTMSMMNFDDILQAES